MSKQVEESVALSENSIFDEPSWSMLKVFYLRSAQDELLDFFLSFERSLLMKVLG
jgi:hypothetical protein